MEQATVLFWIFRVFLSSAVFSTRSTSFHYFKFVKDRNTIWLLIFKPPLDLHWAIIFINSTLYVERRDNKLIIEGWSKLNLAPQTWYIYMYICIRSYEFWGHNNCFNCGCPYKHNINGGNLKARVCTILHKCINF